MKGRIFGKTFIGFIELDEKIRTVHDVEAGARNLQTAAAPSQEGIALINHHEITTQWFSVVLPSFIEKILHNYYFKRYFWAALL